MFLGNNLLSWSSKCELTLSRSSAEAKYSGLPMLYLRLVGYEICNVGCILHCLPLLWCIVIMSMLFTYLLIRFNINARSTLRLMFFLIMTWLLLVRIRSFMFHLAINMHMVLLKGFLLRCLKNFAPA
jgi:predicted membrane channel-forming protein YqfA (hemolysin III family)